MQPQLELRVKVDIVGTLNRARTDGVERLLDAVMIKPPVVLLVQLLATALVGAGPAIQQHDLILRQLAASVEPVEILDHHVDRLRLVVGHVGDLVFLLDRRSKNVRYLLRRGDERRENGAISYQTSDHGVLRALRGVRHVCIVPSPGKINNRSNREDIFGTSEKGKISGTRPRRPQSK